MQEIMPKYNISIHALVKRATYTVQLYKHHWHISIHALVKRATAVAHTGTVSDVDFNPRPRKEGDVRIRTRFYLKHDFNPRPRKEGDHVRSKSGAIATHFNPRPRKEGDTRSFPP